MHGKQDCDGPYARSNFWSTMACRSEVEVKKFPQRKQ